MSMNEKIPLAEGWARLAKEMAEGKPPQIDNPERLHINEIVIAQSVFQPRTFEGNTGDSAAHVSALADAIRMTPDHMLDPITVWWSGMYWRVIDGHHRHMAYKQTTQDAKKPLEIASVPVTVFKGTLIEAFVEATLLNSKDKLPMTKVDKLDRAWRLVALNDENGMSKNEIAAAAKVAARTVTNMRSSHAELMSKTEVCFDGNPRPSFTRHMLINMSWIEAKKQTILVSEKDDEWAEEEAKRWAARIAKSFGNKLARNPSITARAIELYSDRLPTSLLSEWNEMRPDEGEEEEDPGD